MKKLVEGEKIAPIGMMRNVICTYCLLNKDWVISPWNGAPAYVCGDCGSQIAQIIAKKEEDYFPDQVNQEVVEDRPY